MKILYILNVASKVNNFSYAAMLAAKNIEIDFHIAGNWGYETVEQMNQDATDNEIYIYQIDFERIPYNLKNIKAYKQIKKLIRDENIDYIHCNTPVGGLIGRLAGKKCKVKKVIYQAHGFHFYKGAPKKNWLIYHTIEKWLARYTDAIITINKEDFEFAKTLKLKKGGKVYYVPGVGINTKEFSVMNDISKTEKRKELGIPEDAVLLISAGELNQNKNNSVVLDAIAKTKNDNIHYILCGVGPLEQQLKDQAKKLNIADRVHFLGYRTDIKELFATADAFVMSSFREGLSRSIMEAMASGLPCIVSKIRGNVDLIVEGEGGYLCSPINSDEFAKTIDNFSVNSEKWQKMSDFNLEYVKKFDISVVEKEIENIYKEVLN